jgi:hypothetical protein
LLLLGVCATTSDTLLSYQYQPVQSQALLLINNASVPHDLGFVCCVTQSCESAIVLSGFVVDRCRPSINPVAALRLPEPRTSVALQHSILSTILRSHRNAIRRLYLASMVYTPLSSCCCNKEFTNSHRRTLGCRLQQCLWRELWQRSLR